jgi:endo-1,4-beta-xylanase
MKKLLSLLLLLCLAAACFPALGEEQIPSLKEIYAEKFDFGAAAPQSAFAKPELLSLMQRQFSILTPENELKPNYVVNWSGSRKLVKDTGDETAVAVHFSSAKALLSFAKRNGLKVHGHVLVWHVETDESFFHEGYDVKKPLLTRETMLGRLENYIREVMTGLEKDYPGLVVSWDVVNEAIDDGTKTLRKSLWYEIIGEDYVERAFELARKYAPEGTLLYYNDYNTAYPGKLKGILSLLEKLIAEGNIDGYGFQMHHRVLEPGMSMLTNAVKSVAALNLRLRVSELDVGLTSYSEESLQKQAKKYAQVMRLMLQYADQTEAVEVWGLTDNMSYRSYEYPLLFDAKAQPKPAFWAVADPENEQYD